jgi:hypothetical protein
MEQHLEYLDFDLKIVRQERAEKEIVDQHSAKTLMVVSHFF